MPFQVPTSLLPLCLTISIRLQAAKPYQHVNFSGAAYLDATSLFKVLALLQRYWTSIDTILSMQDTRWQKIIEVGVAAQIMYAYNSHPYRTVTHTHCIAACYNLKTEQTCMKMKQGLIKSTETRTDVITTYVAQ